MSDYTIYASEHATSRAVCAAMAEGTGFPIAGPQKLLPGGVIMYGQLRGLDKILNQAKAEGRDFLYADRGYLCATKGADLSGYFRITKNAYQHDGKGESDGKRFAALGLTIKPWRTGGTFILVCPPGEVWEKLHGRQPGEWLKRIKARIWSYPLVIREKNATVPLSEALSGCAYLLTDTSNAAVMALLEGVPVYCTGDCAARAMNDGKPKDRDRFFSVLADAQWTLDEMRSGLAWRMLMNGNR